MDVCFPPFLHPIFNLNLYTCLQDFYEPPDVHSSKFDHNILKVNQNQEAVQANSPHFSYKSFKLTTTFTGLPLLNKISKLEGQRYSSFRFICQTAENFSAELEKYVQSLLFSRLGRYYVTCYSLRNILQYNLQ